MFAREIARFAMTVLLPDAAVAEEMPYTTAPSLLVDEYGLVCAQVMAYNGPRSKNFNHLGFFVYNLTSDPYL